MPIFKFSTPIQAQPIWEMFDK